MTKQDKFAFIKDEEFKKNIISDYNEVVSCHHAGSYKACLVLSGSIIEAILSYYLSYINYSKKLPKNKTSLLELDLIDLINIAKSEKIISKNAESMSHVIREYRNLIHPGRKIRLKEVVEKEESQVALAILDLTIKEIENSFIKKYGKLAEEVIGIILLKLNTNAFEPLISEINEHERYKLINELLPNALFERMTDDGLADEGLINNLRRAYYLCFFKLKKNDKRKIALTISEKCKNLDDIKLRLFLFTFFFSELLKYMPKSDRLFCSSYINSILSQNNLDHIELRAIDGITEYIDDDQLVKSLITKVINTYVFGNKEKADATGVVIRNMKYVNQKIRKDLKHFVSSSRSAIVSELKNVNIDKYIAKLDVLDDLLDDPEWLILNA